MKVKGEIDNTYVLIMAGGLGSRFWPKSRNNFPKQFIDILGIDKSLLQLTYERFLKVCPAENIYILTNEIYIDLVKEQIGLSSDQNIIAEPCRRNTAPCIAYATFKLASLNPDANIVIAPSDHLILKEDTFIEKVKTAISFASQNDALLTLGITPTRPDTGYGYIKFSPFANDVQKVDQFFEKPTLERAEMFVNSGEYVWNAGIFIWSVKSALSALKKYSKALYDVFEMGQSAYNTEEEKEFINLNYPLSENLSIDYALMEKADNVYTIKGDFGWSDLGTWASLHEIMEKDEYENSFAGKSAVLEKTDNCLIQLAKGKVAVIKGLSNFIVVDDANVLLIYPKGMEQEIKAVSANVGNQFGQDFQ